MTIDDETFFAWLDGELDADQADRVAAAVASDPRLSRMAEQHREFETRLRAPFDSVAAAPVPDRLAEAAKASSGRVVRFSALRQASNDNGQWAWPQWAAIAATLVLGIGLGTTLDSERGPAPVEVRGGKMFAASQLDTTLDRQLAGIPSADGTRIGLTFRDQSGTICRTFTDQRASGVACREGEDWQLRGMFAAPEGQSGEYRMAAGMDPNLAGLVDSTIDGEPFEVAQEKAARARGWR